MLNVKPRLGKTSAAASIEHSQKAAGEGAMSIHELQALTSPKSILVATDLFDLPCLLPEAIAQARISGAKLWLLHVVPPEAYVSPNSGAYPFVAKEKVVRDAEEVLGAASRSVQAEGIVCSYEVRRWEVVEETRAFIREKGIERVILGTSSRGKLGKVLLGSIAEELIRTVNVPVCTIGPTVKIPSGTGPSKILFAMSLNHTSDLSFQFAEDLASELEAELTVLHVLAQAKPADVAEAEKRIREAIDRASLFGTAPRLRIRVGNPAAEILSEANALRPVSMILGAVPSSAAAATFRTGTAYKVISQAPCPVFTMLSASNHKATARELVGTITKIWHDTEVPLDRIPV